MRWDAAIKADPLLSTVHPKSILFADKSTFLQHGGFLEHVSSVGEASSFGLCFAGCGRQAPCRIRIFSGSQSSTLSLCAPPCDLLCPLQSSKWVQPPSDYPHVVFRVPVLHLITQILALERMLGS